MAKTSKGVKQRIRINICEPRFYSIEFINDDVTTQEFVIDILKKYFCLDDNSAYNTMLKIHNQGRALVGTLTHDLAYSIKTHIDIDAQDNGYPLETNIKEV